MTRSRFTLLILRRGWRLLQTLVGATAMTMACFLVLPGIQALGDPITADTDLQSIDTAALPPPPVEEPMEEPEPEEEEPEEEPPELNETSQPLDLNMLNLSMGPAFGDGWPGADMAMNFGGGQGNKDDSYEELFALGELDQKPRATFRSQPVISSALRKRAPATVHVMFIVDERGRVSKPKVKKSTDPAFDRAAITAIKKWKFEPAKKDGKPVSKKMVVPITFPKGS